MSNPLKLKSLNHISNLSGWDKTVVTRDINKIFLDNLKESKPDYIIIDLVSEIEYGIIKVDDSYISNIRGKTNKINLNDYNKQIITINSDKKLYIDLLKDSINLFKEFCKVNLPKTKLIFHIAPYLYSYFDGCRVPKSFENKDLITKNSQLKELYDINITQNEDLVIDINNKTYFSTSKHKLPLNPLHYETQYYTDFISELNRIVLKEFIKENDKKCKK